jgi:pimeloyl-ACP methyl ester carboxylesterase
MRTVSSISFEPAKVGPVRALLGGNLYFSTELDRDIAIVFLADFNRAGTDDMKFNVIAGKLDLPCVTFDYAGLGRSLGNTLDFTVSKATEDFRQVIASLRASGFKKFYAVAHSLGACVLGKYLATGGDFVEKAILLAPALNQWALLRYWFTRSFFPEENIGWESYLAKFYQAGEEEFLKWCSKAWRAGDNDYGADYRQENREADYSGCFSDFSRIACIHGSNDVVVPEQSVKIRSDRVFYLRADHDFIGKEEDLAAMISGLLPLI